MKTFGSGNDYGIDGVGDSEVGPYMSGRLVELNRWYLGYASPVPAPESPTPGASPTSGSAVLFDSTIDDLHPGVVTAQDVIGFSNFMLLRLLAPSNRDLLQLNEDAIVNAGDLGDLRGYADDGKITDVEAEAFISLATSVGLVDNNFDLDSLISVLEAFGLVLSIAGVVLLTGGSGLAPYVLGAAAASEGGVVVVKLVQGDFDGAALSAVFLVFDAAELATASKLILKRSQKAYRALRSADTATGSVDLVGDAERLVDAARLRPGDVNPTAAGDLAVIEATTREDLYVEMAGLTTPARADAYVDAYFDSLVEGLDDPTNYDELLAAVKSDPAGADAYVRWGDEVIDDSGGLVDDFADAVRGCSLQVAQNSFGASTYVVLADGTRKRIGSIQAGDLVASWDSSHGVVASEVTATWPHRDVLYQAHLSDASTLVVTEDHEFYDLAEQDWVQISEFGADSEFRTVAGGDVGLASFDFGSATTERAYDLTVASTHNYFVAADLTSHAVLAHNQGGPCPKFEVPSNLVTGANALGDTDYTRMVDIGNAFVDGGRFTEGAALADELVAFIKTADPATRTRLLNNPRWVQEAGTAGPGRFSNVLNAGLAQPTLFDDWSVEKLSALIVRADSDEIFARLAGLPADRFGSSTELLDLVTSRGDAVDLLDALAESKGYGDLIQRQLGRGNSWRAGQIADGIVDFRAGTADFAQEFTGPNAAASLAGSLDNGTRPSAWLVVDTDRGDLIEELYYVRNGGRIPAELDDIRAFVYPLVDSLPVEDGLRIAEQLKTVDFAGRIQDSGAISSWKTRMRLAFTKLDEARSEGILAYTREGLFIPAVPAGALDGARLRIVVSGFGLDPALASAQQVALQQIVDEGAARGIIVVIQTIQ